jgi:hypothetical protein
LRRNVKQVVNELEIKNPKATSSKWELPAPRDGKQATAFKMEE